MNYLFFSGRLSYGGGEKVRNWLACQLAKSGDVVFYATQNYSNEYKEQLSKLGMQGAVRVIQYDYQQKKCNILAYFRQICRIYRENHIDVLIYFGGSLIEQLAARKCGVKIILSERCEPTSRPILSQILKKIQYKIADGYVFQTPEAAACYGKKATRIGTIIPNPIIDKLEDPQFDNLRKEIVSVGRLSKEKNQEGLIEAFSIFHEIYPDYHLKIYGTGILKETLIKKSQKLNISEFVEIVSGKTNISEIIKGAELFVLNSDTEGMPNALIEAMSMGVLSISTDCPIFGPRLLVQHGVNAYLTPVRRSDLLADLMIYAINHKERGDMIRHNAVKIRERLEENKIFAQWKTYLESNYKCSIN